MNIRLVDFSEEFLELSYWWLNDVEMRNLTNTPYFTREDQRKWFNNLRNKKDYLIWGIEFNTVKIGACGLKHITDDDAEYWGYIGEKKYRGKGIGLEMLNSIIEIAREMKLERLWLVVNKDNLPAIKLYKKSGFVTIDESDSQIRMSKTL